MQDLNPKQIQTLSTLVSRMELATRLGYQYGGDRDIYEALGYETNLEYKDYLTQYSRQDMAKAIIDRPANATWRGDIKVFEKDNPDSAFEKAWDELVETLKLKSKFVRLDKLSSLGAYGVLLLGMNDVSNKEDWIEPVIGNRELMYVKPLGEGNAVISSWVVRTANPRYGLPLTYDIEIVQPGDSASTTLRVHYSRILHITGELLESEVEGIPKLQPVFNRLKDLEKVVGGSAEMFWRGARPGFHGNVDDKFQLTQDTKDDLQDQLDEYEHNLRRILVTKGIDFKELGTQVSDPSKHVDTLIQMISAETGIPKRILTGSERGELASSQDRDNWLEMIQTRREEYAEPQILRGFIDICIEYGILPKSTIPYSIEWTDLFAMSDKEKVTIGKDRATALKEYSMNPVAQSIIPWEMFYKLFLGLTDDQIELIDNAERREIEEENGLNQEPEE